MPHNVPNESDASVAGINHSSSERRDLTDLMITRLNDATVFGDLESPESQKVLNSELIVGFSSRAPKVASHNWMQIKGPFAGALDLLTQHPVRKKKDGSAFFFNETELTGRTSFENGAKLPCVYRGKAYAKSVTAFAVDVDGTDHIQRVRDKLRELGIFGILYTTHSHARKRSASGDYFRVLVQLERPFDVAALGANVKVASETWTTHYEAFAEKLEIEELDLSAAKFVQMMYLPRRLSADASYEHYVVAGRALTFDDMPCAVEARAKFAANDVHPRQRGRFSGRVKTQRPVRPVNSLSRRHKLSDGFDARRFHHDYGNRFTLPTFLKELNWEVRNESAGNGMTIKCPNHHEHTEPDDGSDSACWCSPADTGNRALIMCHHNHCRDLKTWHFLPLIEDKIAVGEAVLPTMFNSLSEMICAKEFYHA